MRTGWMRTVAAGSALGLALAAGPAHADVTVERYVKSGGFMGFGAGETTMVEKIAGLRRRDDSTMKIGGFIGKMTGEMRSDTITDVAKDKLWTIDHKKKTYTEAPVTPPPMKEEAPGAPEREEPAEKPKVRVVRNEVTVKETGESRTIAGRACKEWVITWVVETENLETKERSENTMAMDLWNASEDGDLRALAEAEREYHRAWLKKIGWEMSDDEARKMGLGVVAALLGDDPSLRKGAKEVAEKLAKIKGYPLGTGVKWNIATTGGASAQEKGSGPGGGEGGMPDIAKGLGGLMSAFGKKAAKKDAGGKESGADKGGKPVFETYSEIRSIAVGGLPDGDFAPPAGYKLVKP